MIPESNLYKILEKFRIGNIQDISPLNTSGNLTYVIKTKQGEYLLRFSPLGFRGRSKKEIAAELELINYLIKNGFPTPKPIATQNSDFVISYEEHHGYLREYGKGKHKENPTPKEVKKFGRLLGRFHSLIKGYKTKEERVHVWDPETTKQNLKEDQKIILASNFPNKKAFIEQYENELSLLTFPTNLPEGTIHEDLGKRHVLWEKDEITAIIDFDRCYYGKLILDLGQACRGWCFVNNWAEWSNENFQTLISGYEKERKLSEQEKNYLPNAIKFGVLERALSFALHFGKNEDIDDADFAWQSLNEILSVTKKPLNL